MWTAPRTTLAFVRWSRMKLTDYFESETDISFFVVKLESAAIMFQEVTTAGLVAMMITLVIGSCALGACCAEMQDRRVKRD